ncbi:DUF3427 domain-containing protein [Bradyrhizobium sp. USDA 4471]
MDRLVRSWELAGSIAPVARSVSLASNGFRLSVGQVEALTFFDGSIRVLLAAPANDKRLANLPIRDTSYSSFRGRQSVFEGTPSEYNAAKYRIDPLHNKFVEAAATRRDGSPRQGSPFVSSHVEEVIAYAASYSSTAATLQERAPRHSFNVGTEYSRRDIFSVLGIKDHSGGPWFTGYTSHGPDWFIFCGVGTGGRTGHDYRNHFQGDELVWFGKNGSRLHQPSVQNLLAPSGHVYLFYREQERDPFTFAGLAYPVQAYDETPVKIRWRFRSGTPERPDYLLPEEVDNGLATITEGARKSVVVVTYERDPNARRKCIAHWGTKCCVCEFDFSRHYGDDLGKGFIHVHHLKPLGEIGEAYELNPISDLRPVCPNCHAMLHRQTPALTIDALKEIMRKQKAI